MGISKFKRRWLCHRKSHQTKIGGSNEPPIFFYFLSISFEISRFRNIKNGLMQSQKLFVIFATECEAFEEFLGRKNSSPIYRSNVYYHIFIISLRAFLLHSKNTSYTEKAV